MLLTGGARLSRRGRWRYMMAEGTATRATDSSRTGSARSRRGRIRPGGGRASATRAGGGLRRVRARGSGHPSAGGGGSRVRGRRGETAGSRSSDSRGRGVCRKRARKRRPHRRDRGRERVWGRGRGGRGAAGAPHGARGELIRTERRVPEMPELPESRGVSVRTAGNTTLACVCTDATLDKRSCAIVARMASAGIARAVNPAFTPVDGDVVFAWRRDCERHPLPVSPLPGRSPSWVRSPRPSRPRHPRRRARSP